MMDIQDIYNSVLFKKALSEALLHNMSICITPLDFGASVEVKIGRYKHSAPSHIFLDRMAEVIMEAIVFNEMTADDPTS